MSLVLLASFAGLLTVQAKPTVVLVHGAFAHASSWDKVATRLKADGYPVVAVELPLTDLDADVAEATRAIESVKGPVVVVGHSYGGAVITGAAAGEANVKRLVYVAAFAPDADEKLKDLNAKFPPVPLADALVSDDKGFLSIAPTKFHDVFCADLPGAEAAKMAETQKPLNAKVFEGELLTAAWKTIPTTYLVATEDRAISPELERWMAKRMRADTKEIKSSHVPMLSHGQEVTDAIEMAANAPSGTVTPSDP